MKRFLGTILGVVLFGYSIVPTICVADRFGNALDDAKESVAVQVDAGYNGVQGGAAGVRDAIIDMVKKIIVPAIIILGVLIAILGFYTLLSSSKEDDQKKGINYIMRGVIGIVVMMAASFLATTLVQGGIFEYDTAGGLVGTVTAQNIYTKLMFPFIKFTMYFIIGILFVLALLRTIQLVMSTKDDMKQKAITIIQRNAFGIIIIIFAKELIEAVYGTQAEVVNSNAQSLGQIGSGVLANKDIPFVYTVINWGMSLLAIFIVVMIIVQAIQLLSNPTDEATQKKMRKNVIYTLIGLVIMGTAYVVTNFLIIK